MSPGLAHFPSALEPLMAGCLEPTKASLQELWHWDGPGNPESLQPPCLQHSAGSSLVFPDIWLEPLSLWDSLLRPRQGLMVQLACSRLERYCQASRMETPNPAVICVVCLLDQGLAGNLRAGGFGASASLICKMERVRNPGSSCCKDSR